MADHEGLETCPALMRINKLMPRCGGVLVNLSFK